MKFLKICLEISTDSVLNLKTCSSSRFVAQYNAATKPFHISLAVLKANVAVFMKHWLLEIKIGYSV